MLTQTEIFIALILALISSFFAVRLGAALYS